MSSTHTVSQPTYEVGIAPDGSTTARAEPCSEFGDMLWFTAGAWAARCTVTQYQTVPANRAAEVRDHVERETRRRLFVQLADGGLVPVLAPRVEWFRLPPEAVHGPVAVSSCFDPESGAPLPGDGRRMDVFVPGHPAEPGTVVICRAQVRAMPAPGGDARSDTEEPEGCRCHSCGVHYRVDFNVPDALWQRIGMSEDAMLCGPCITRRIEQLGQFGAYALADLVPDDLTDSRLVAELQLSADGDPQKVIRLLRAYPRVVSVCRAVIGNRDISGYYDADPGADLPPEELAITLAVATLQILGEVPYANETDGALAGRP